MRSAIGQLLVSAARVRRQQRQTQLRHDLSWLQRGCEEVLEEVVSGNLTLTVRAARNDRGLQCQHQAGHIRGGVRVGHAAADRAAIAHLLIADQRGAFGQKREMAAQHL